jgi:hypothetical protein
MRIARKWKIEKIAESFAAAVSGDAGCAHVAAQNLRDLQVKQMRSMQRLTGGKQDTAHTPSCRRLQKNFKNRGSVYNDQRPFLSARTAAAGAGRGCTDWRRESRFRISSRVGRSRAWRSSRSR